MAIESKNLLTLVKAYSRGNPYPIDVSDIWLSEEGEDKTPLERAQEYVQGMTENPVSSVAYIGQILRVEESGKIVTYVIADENGTLLKLADTATMNMALEVKANISDVNTALDSKLNIADIEAIPDSEILALFST